ncbi:YciI family protein [Bordetella genomosp. 9]|uniref:YCII-related domain-containing protein n=1 Tax=Bordetella genomosp. 9 TaxID=1416803 RepID=A0A1W6YWU4_9BORD|nr:YciI family protein [Bordetella genomosp. 9]ARP85498.1 hypothetical protein CAL13_04175 [Bordetella genomosp. 9]ARP89474.1 hypothetical protein CAL14_03530 [Bordetella genomosp. 9]
MRFLIIVKATAATEAGVMPEESLFAAMADYHEALAKAGVLLDAAGLRPTSEGWRIDYRDGARTLTFGPFAMAEGGLMAGYTLIQVRSRDEALEWSRRFPAPHGATAPAQIEVRPLYEAEDFAPGASRDRLRALRDHAGLAA